MPDPVVTEAARSFIKADPVLGALCILLIAALVFRERMWRADMKTERDAHDITRQKHLADVKDFARIGESMRDQMKTLVTTFENVIDMVKDRGR